MAIGLEVVALKGASCMGSKNMVLHVLVKLEATKDFDIIKPLFIAFNPYLLLYSLVF